jgi:hypothetical protein
MVLTSKEAYAEAHAEAHAHEHKVARRVCLHLEILDVGGSRVLYTYRYCTGLKRPSAFWRRRALEL